MNNDGEEVEPGISRAANQLFFAFLFAPLCMHELG